MAIELVIFDFDGTLVDTAPDLIRAANFFIEAQGYEPIPAETIRQHIGMGLRKLIQDTIPAEAKDDDFLRKIEGGFLATYEREYLHSPTLFDGAREFLGEWDRSIAIVSNKRERFIRPILEKLEVLNFPWKAIIGGDTYPNMKPHPEPFLGAMLAAGVTPEETLIVGDGVPDILGALAVGSPSVACEHGYEPITRLMDLGATYRVDTFHSLLPLIRKINENIT